MDKKKYLFVDLDGSLIKSDLLLESFFNSLSKDIFSPVKCLVAFYKNGIVGLKHFLSKNSSIEIRNLPFNNEVIDYISDWRAKNQGEVILISASHNSFVKNIATYLEIFDFSYGTEEVNLKSQSKLNAIKKHCHESQFDYIGDSSDDLVIWKFSDNPILVNPKKRIKEKVRQFNKNFYLIHNKSGFIKDFFKLIRLHQWSKNLLLFLPMVLAMSFSSTTAINTFAGFVSFSLVASSFYIFNDLLDIENDRSHPSKKFRSLASGSFSISKSILISLIFIFFSALIALNLNQSFQLILLFYAFMTFIYSNLLKKIPVVDIITLACLYVVRIISGASIASLEISNWLITFSVFFFLFLAAIKRWIEIEKSSDSLISSRGYVKEDINFITNLSYLCGLISVLIICLYIDSQQASLIYSNSRVLWFVPMIFLFWIVETLFLVSRKAVDDDPVAYALKSKTSYVCAIFLITIFYFAT
jgi:4-hydroxybenzoate polyprenyltransferase